MLWLAVRQLVSRRLATSLMALGLLTAALGFVALAGTARQTTASLRGDIGRAWDTPFDLLVRPSGAVSPIERQAGLVRPNYVTGIHGGITTEQLAAVRASEGVSIAAPIAVVGFVSWPSAFLTPLTPPKGAGVASYRVRATALGSAKLSRYPIEMRYVLVATRGRLDMATRILTVGGQTFDCTYPVDCYAPVVCGPDGCEKGGFPSTAEARYYLPLQQPIVIAGVDPPAEAAIGGLDNCIDSGRALTREDAPSHVGAEDEPIERIPVLISKSSFVDQSLIVTIDRAGLAALARSGDPASIRNWQRVLSRRIGFGKLYRDYLPSVRDYLDPWPVWSSGDVDYRRLGPSGLAAIPKEPDLSVYRKVRGYSEFGIPDALLIPPEAQDVAFRSVVEHKDTTEPAPGSLYRVKLWDEVGTYRPECLRGFDRLAGGRLDIYATPRVELPDGAVLRPTRSMADYVNSPPLLLTNLAGAAWLSNPRRYSGQPGKRYISVIRVRVAGTDTPGPGAKERLANVAAAIHVQTGLRVDIVKGASPRTIAIALPEGRFGRPAMRVREAWSQKGVAVRFAQAVDLQGLAFLSVAFIAAMTAVGQTASISVRRRRREFAMLRALGWPAGAVARAVLSEIVVLALTVAGLVAVGALAAVHFLAAPVASWVILTAIPLTAVVAVAAALPSIISSSRGAVVRVMARSSRPRRSALPRTSVGLALRELRGPWAFETVFGSLAIAAGAFLVASVVLVGGLFSSRLDETALGTFLAGEVRPFHIAIAVLTALVGALAASQMVLLGYLERRLQLAVLRAQGWTRPTILSYIAAQGAALALIAALVAGGATFLEGHLLGLDWSQRLLAAAAGTAVSAACGALAVAGPALLAYRGNPATILRGE